MGTDSFYATRWSIVRGAGASDPDVRRAAFERLCVQYWFPLFAYLRRSGRTSEHAADLVQGLFTRLLEGDRLAQVVEGPGRFRNWILTALQNHARDEHAREAADKRGGGRAPVAIDAGEGERRLQIASADDDDPSVAFERAWAREVLTGAHDLLEREMHAKGKGALFDALAEHLEGEALPNARSETAAELGLSPVALRVALHRLRTRYRQQVVAIVADSLDGRAELGAELRELAWALGRDAAGP